MPIIGRENIDNYIKNRDRVKKENVDKLLKIIYDKFNQYFISGDLIISGSLSYIALNLIENKPIKDIDIAIISGENGDIIINEIIQFFQNQSGTTVMIRDWNELRAVIQTPYGMIDIFRDDFHNKINGIDVEIINGVYSKYNGHEWILRILLNKYYWFLNHQNDSAHCEQQRIKFMELIKKIYQNVKLTLDDIELIGEIEGIVN